jgi:ParB/RepB/Spo0J family partition protein
MDDVRLIPTSDIREPRTLLRLVDRNSIEYLELRDSVAKHGFLCSISVRPANEPGKFEIIEGLHRYCVAKDLALAMMPCIVKQGVCDAEIPLLQIQGNLQGVDTKPSEYARQIKAILTSNPDMTEKELAVRLSKSPAWINTLLGLLRLPPDIQKKIDRSDIPVLSGYMLSRLPQRLQREYVTKAQEMSAKDFRRVAAAVIKHFQEAVQFGRLEDFYTREFTPHPYLRHLKEIQAEMAHHHQGPALVASLGCQTAIDGFYAALQWIIHLDPQSIVEQQKAARARERTQFEETLDDDLT